MTNDDLITIIEAHRRDSLGHEDGELSNERATAMDHYHGRPYGNEMVGRSAVVSRDLAEAVDWAMPAIMRAFTQSGSVGEFDPVGPEDEELAKQESDYCNQVIMKDNNGFMILHDAVKDTLLLKNGYVKHWWDEETTTTEEEYSGLTMDQIAQLFADFQKDSAEVEILEQESEQVIINGQPVEVFELCLRITKKACKVRIEAVPCEEIRVSKRCRGSLQDSPFVEHITRKSRSELVQMGMDKDFVYSLPSYEERQNSSEITARDTVTDESAYNGRTLADRSMDEIEYCEAYVRVDYDGDGVAELRKVVTVANQIPDGEEWNEPIEACAITGWTAKRVPHRHVGESLDDELADLQEIKTALERQTLDNVYATNNNQWLVNERVVLKDFLQSLPGGVKRVKGDGPIGDAVEPVVVPSILDKILPVVDYYDRRKEQRTGISRASTVMDPDVLRETTKGAFLEGLNRASQKVEMITRMLAESGLKEMFLQVHGLLIRHQDKPRVVQMRGKWVTINPKEWRDRTDLSVRVGLGTGNQEEQRQKLGILAQMQGHLLQAVAAAPPPVYERMYAMFEDTAKSMGIEIPQKYAITPMSQEHQQIMQMAHSQPNPEMMKVQADMQAQQARIQADAQLSQMEMKMQAQVDAHRQQVESEQQRNRMMMEMQLQQVKQQMQMDLERERARLKAEVDILIAKIDAQAKLDAAQISANTVLTPAQEAASDGAVG